MSWAGNDDELIDGALRRAAAIVERVDRQPATKADRLLRLIRDPAGQRFGRELVDRVARPRDDRTAMRGLVGVLAELGIPGAVGIVDRGALLAARRIGPILPGLVAPLARRRLRTMTSAAVLPAEDRFLRRHLALRGAEGFTVNLNLLGEAILGDHEASRRARDVGDLVARDDVRAVSMKASSVVANLSDLAEERSTARLVDVLRSLLSAAAASDPPRLVTLDMEEYRDLELSLDAFMRALEDPNLDRLEAGIVLQAYLPDSVSALEELARWAARRHARTGVRVKVRIVKGANLAMELVDAELHGWELATYGSKHEVDANYTRLVERALHPDHLPALRVGVASHNPFDLAWALELRSRCTAPENVEIEMLEGMAQQLARAVRPELDSMLLYTPIVVRAEFPSAIAYLARRIVEVGAPENVLGRLPDLRTGSADYQLERDRFERSVRSRRTTSVASRRLQDRSRERHESPTTKAFANAADTDFTRPANRRWIKDALARAMPDPPEPARSLDHVDHVVARGVATGGLWAATSPVGRRAVLERIADAIADHRGEAISHMVHEGHKSVMEADVEVSEAIDLARYYAEAIGELASLDRAEMIPRGVVVVTPPWNFPYAIPAGGVLAALAAGSAVILKPAPQAPSTAWLLARIIADAGVPDGLLQYLRCDDDTIGRRLVTHPDVGAVILTGSIETAKLFRSWNPRMRLHAETSGKNAIVVTAAADLDQAVRDLVRSAFGHSGQKCSAASLAIVEGPVYDDEGFRRQLADAVISLPVGPATELDAVVTPLIGPPSPALDRALRQLDPGETWLVRPECRDPDVHLWSPGVRLGVQPGSWFHRTECFGPVLGVLRADDLDHAIAMQNAVAFGLTGGIQSLEPAEVVRWAEQVEVGNAYVNRPITGAVVRRQPFGGWKASAVGPGTKTGGPNYVLSLCGWRVAARGDMTSGRATVIAERARDVLADARHRLDAGGLAALERTAADYSRWWDLEFAGDHDPSGLSVESNRLRYRSLVGGVVVVADDTTDPLDLERAALAAAICGTRSVVVAPGALVSMTGLPDRIRLLGGAYDDAVWKWASERLVHVDDHPVVDHGRLELWRWLREQTVTETTHRYGTIVGRAVERLAHRTTAG